MNLHTYVVDQRHSSVQFRVRHLGFSRVTGRFHSFSARIRMNPVSLSHFCVEAIIEAASVNTGDEERDQHLRSADFLNVDAYPHIFFQGRDVRAVSIDRFELHGDLTLHGITRPEVLHVQYLGEAVDLTGQERVAFDSRARINRKDYGLTWNNVLQTGGLLVGESVDVQIEIQAVRQETEHVPEDGDGVT